MFFSGGNAPMFAVALTLVVLISAAVLLHQYWTGALLSDDSAVDPATDALTPTTLHIDRAA
jgi:hypothetical protein